MTRAFLAVAALAVVVAVVVVTRQQVETDEQRAQADGRQLAASFVVALDHRAVAGVTATLTISNPSDSPGWYLGSNCAGPELPVVMPNGDPPRPAMSWRESIVTNGRVVELGRDGLNATCDILPVETPVRLDPGDSVTFEYSSGGRWIDRSKDVHGVVLVTESNERGDSLGDLRLDASFERLPGALDVPLDDVVDTFLADVRVADYVADVGGGSSGTVRRVPDGWRVALSSSTEPIDGHVRLLGGTFIVDDVVRGGRGSD